MHADIQLTIKMTLQNNLIIEFMHINIVHFGEIQLRKNIGTPS